MNKQTRNADMKNRIKQILIDYAPLLEEDVKTLTGSDRQKAIALLEIINSLKREQDLNEAHKECDG